MCPLCVGTAGTIFASFQFLVGSLLVSAHLSLPLRRVATASGSPHEAFAAACPGSTTERKKMLWMRMTTADCGCKAKTWALVTSQNNTWHLVRRRGRCVAGSRPAVNDGNRHKKPPDANTRMKALGSLHIKNFRQLCATPAELTSMYDRLLPVRTSHPAGAQFREPCQMIRI